MSNYKEAKLKIKNLNMQVARKALERIRKEVGQGTIQENHATQEVTLYVSQYAYYTVQRDGTVGYDDYAMSKLKADEFKQRFAVLYSQEILAEGMRMMGLEVSQKETEQQLLVIGAGASGTTGTGGRWV